MALKKLRISRAYQAILFNLAALGLLGFMIVESFGFTPAARTAPLLIGTPALVLCALQLARDAYKLARGDSQDVGATATGERDVYADAEGSDNAAASPGDEDWGGKDSTEVDSGGPRTLGGTSLMMGYAWVIGLAALIYVVGMLAAIPVFIVLFMRTYGKERVLPILIVVSATTGGIYVLFVLVLEVQLYRGELGLGL